MPEAQQDMPQATVYATPGNPVPEGISVAFLKLRDGKKIRYALFPAISRPLKGTVVIMPGRNECIEKYYETMLDLAKRGFGIATFDWIGQGGSDRLIKDPQKGYITSFERYVDEFEQFFDNVALPDCRGPFYILAHSTGSLVALLGSPKLINRVRRMVLCAPLLALTNQPLGHNQIRRISGLLSWLGLGRLYMSGGARPRETLPFIGNKLTSDLDRYRRNSVIYEEHRELALGGPTMRWVNASCKAMDRVMEPSFKAKIQIPTLIIAAGNDEIVSNAAIERFVRGLRSGAMITIDGAKHEMLQEKDIYREQVLAAFDAFVPGQDASLG